MGNVLIIKNNSIHSDIYNFARESFRGGKKGYYNTMDGSANEAYLEKIKHRFGEKGLVLFVTYNGDKMEDVIDIFIGANVEINAKNNVEYCMKVHLDNDTYERVIKSIIDKIDLDINKDFEENCYVSMSDMDSLFDELQERLHAKFEPRLNTENILVDLKEDTYVISPLAQKDMQAVRIYPSEGAGVNCTEFQRDRERVVNCKAFRRMVDKAQIFGAEKGDYYRTRMTHSLEVNQIAKAIAYALKLNLDLTEAIALGHDLGHTPFGHQGERTLDDILCGKQDVGIVAERELFDNRCFGGFKHNYQSARVLTELEEKYVEFPGLNVSVQVVEGVLKHTRIKPNEISLGNFIRSEYLDKIYIDYDNEIQVCSSLEGQVVAIADEIAQRGHDVDDALTSGVISIDEFVDRLKISKCSILQEKIKNERENIAKTSRCVADKRDLQIARVVSCIVNYFIETTIEHSMKNMEKCSKRDILLNNDEKIIEFSPEVEGVNSYLERVVQKKVICNSEVARADYNANMIVKKLFEKYYENPRLLHEGTIHKIFLETLRSENAAVANSAINLSDCSIKIVNEEIEEITTKKMNSGIVLRYIENRNKNTSVPDVIRFEKRRILIRAITDYIAGMTDGYALEEYEKLK